jgi:hypothetical protein
MPFIAIAGRQIEYRIIRPTRRSQRSALIHAAPSARPVEALARMAPHVFVEPRTLESMPHPRGLLPSDLRARLAVHHAHVMWMTPSLAGRTPGCSRSSNLGRSKR